MNNGVAVLAGGVRRNLATELLHQELHAVADAQYRQAALEHVGGCLRGALFVDAGWAAGEDERARLQPLNLLSRSIVGEQLTVHVALAHAAGDQHAVLGTEVEDDDRLRSRRGRHRISSFALALASDL